MIPDLEMWLSDPVLAFKALQFDKKARDAGKEAEKYRKRIEARKAEEAKNGKVEEPKKQEKEKTVERVNGEEIIPNNDACPSTVVYDEKTGQYKISKSKTNYDMFFKKPEIIDVEDPQPAPENKPKPRSPFIRIKKKMSYDDIENIISYVNKDMKKCENMSDDVVRCAVLPILVMTDVMSLFDMYDHFNDNYLDTKLVINAVANYLVRRHMLIEAPVNDLEQYMSVNQLKLIIESLASKTNIGDNEEFKNLVKIINKRSKKKREAERKGIKEFPNVADPIIEEAIVPDNNKIFNIREPRINHKVMEYLIYRFSEILKEDEHFMFQINGLIDNYDVSYNVRDIAQAVIKCTDMQDGSYCIYSIDLNTIVGNGFNLIVPTRFKDVLMDVYVNIDKHPDIVRKLLTTNYKFSANGSYLNDLDLKTVMEDQLSYAQIYRFYDFSGMYKHMKNMSKEDKNTLSNNLITIASYNWSSVLGPGAIMPRFRFRDYKDPTTFILVSDKNVRVQSSTWMSTPYGLYAKQFIVGDPAYHNSKSEIVIELNNNEIRFYIDKREVVL